MKSSLKLSIVTPTLNAGEYIERFLKSIRSQDYPQNKVEIIISDGGSKDKTIFFAKKYKAKIVNNIHKLAEPGVQIGAEHATGDLIMILAVDNIFKNKNDFTKIVSVFNDSSIYAAFPKHISSSKDSLFSKYINAFTDPFNHFVYGSAANARTFHRIYKTELHTPIFDIYDFSSNKVRPILALAQGFTVRTSFMKTRKNTFDDIAPVLSLINDHKKIAYVYSVGLVHHTIKDLAHFIKKQRWTVRNAVQKKDFGINIRNNTLTTSQKIKKYFFPIYSLSIILPLLVSVYNYLRDKEKIWFFHPVITFITAGIIVVEYIGITLKVAKDFSRA